MDKNIIICACVVIILIIVIGIISVFNKFKRLNNKINEAASGIDVALSKRYQLITQMVEIIKGYMKYENDILTHITELRNSMTMKEKSEINTYLDKASNKIIAVSEGYPELKANESFLVLQKTLFNVEEHLAASRRMYNSNVTKFNECLESFPSNIIGFSMKLNKKEYFEALDKEKNNVDIKI